MHATKLSSALVLLFVAVLLSNSCSGEARSEESGDLNYKSCPDCNLSCDINVTLGEEKNRISCYGILDRMISSQANPKGWKFNWEDKGTSDMVGSAWHHDRGCVISGVRTQNGIFDHTITNNGMTAKITCGGCA